MIVTLGDLARDGARDPRDVVGPFVTALVELRARAREHRDWATSDLLRDRLSAAGVEVRDTPEGPEWSLARDRA
jgi:cysteinyl-tRNA synthetase